MYKQGTTGLIKSPVGLTFRDFLSQAQLKVSAAGRWDGRTKAEQPLLTPRLMLDGTDGIQQMSSRWSRCLYVSFPKRKANHYFNHQRVARVTVPCDETEVSSQEQRAPLEIPGSFTSSPESLPPAQSRKPAAPTTPDPSLPFQGQPSSSLLLQARPGLRDWRRESR